MNEELFQKKIMFKDMSRWICPHCNKGKLKLNKAVKNDLTNTIPLEKINLHNDLSYQNIAGFLECDYCLKKVTFIASEYFEHNLQKNPNGIIEVDEDYLEYRPYFFKPPLHIIELNEFIPNLDKPEPKR